MSYMRPNHILRYFKEGVSDSYVFPIEDKKVEDYGDNYKNNISFCELIGNFVKGATNNEEYAWKIVCILAKKLRIANKLRNQPLNEKEWFKLDIKHMEKEINLESQKEKP